MSERQCNVLGCYKYATVQCPHCRAPFCAEHGQAHRCPLDREERVRVAALKGLERQR